MPYTVNEAHVGGWEIQAPLGAPLAGEVKDTLTDAIDALRSLTFSGVQPDNILTRALHDEDGVTVFYQGPADHRPWLERAG